MSSCTFRVVRTVPGTGMLAGILEPYPPLLPRKTPHNMSPPRGPQPPKREVCTPTPARAWHSEPKGDLMADPGPSHTAPRLCCQLETQGPPPASLLPGKLCFCTHSAIYSLWQHSNHKAASAFNRHSPHSRSQGTHAQEAPRPPAHPPILQERKLAPGTGAPVVPPYTCWPRREAHAPHAPGQGRSSLYP